ncbi:hypothetical protein GWK47_035275 [Chionoecetes opilio]|uniref:Single domain-containing protein n=1 Tax=Chionoecetes opilio TaxID=41210 RepID=A0A8J5D2H7_CHIOP|nr:hypothetical protein GWK47_035275 [Chionoecetes opilio]
MKSIVLACVVLAVGVAAQQDRTNVVHEAKLVTRTLVADVLRDAPGLCYGSTTRLYYEEGMTWDLEVFCGKSTCMKNATGFFEIVNDCAAPKPNEKCQPIIPQPGSVFPECCPQFECMPGATLEYPTEAEIKAEIKKAEEAQKAEQLKFAALQKEAAATAAPEA